jgi:hypothetical protein
MILGVLSLVAIICISVIGMAVYVSVQKDLESQNELIADVDAQLQKTQKEYQRKVGTVVQVIGSKQREHDVKLNTTTDTIADLDNAVQETQQKTRATIDTLDRIGQKILATDTTGVHVKGVSKFDKVQLGDKFNLSGIGDGHGSDEWLRVMGKDGKDYHGGVAAGKLWSKGDVYSGGNIVSAGEISSKGLTASGNSAINDIRFSKGWTGYPDDAKDRSEISNDTGTYKALMIVGNKSAGAERRVDVWDKLAVHGNVQVDADLNVNGTMIASGNSAINEIRFSKSWTGYPDNAINRSEISNDTGNYKSLMIVGNKSAGAERRVDVWDKLSVHGNVQVDADLKVNGTMNASGASTVNDIRLSKGWTAYPDHANDRSEISNDTGNYKSLMIVGNRSAGAERRVDVWDRLNVNGDFCIRDVCINKDDLLRMKSK